MKKVLYFAALALMFAASSCEKSDIGGTATEKMAGQWYVLIDGVDEAGQPVADDYCDLFGDGNFFINTYNTAANDPTKMFIEELGDVSLCGLKARINVNQDNMTFSSGGEVENLSENSNAKYSALTITDGKIMLGAAHQPNGSVCDSIVFYVSFKGDPYPAAYGYTKYRVRGVRYSGLAEND